MIETLTVLGTAVLLFVTGKIRSDIVALCALITLMLLGILTPEEALSGFSNTIVIMMIGLFVVGGAIFQTGLAKKISGCVMRLAGKSELRLFILMVAVTAVIGSIMSNTGTAALMLPIVVSLAAGAGIKASRLLMPLAFTASMSGLLTLISSPANLVVQGTLVDAGFTPLHFFSFLPVGAVAIVVGTVVMLPLSRLFLSHNKDDDNASSRVNKSLNQLVDEYHLADNLSIYRVTEASSVKGKTVADVGFHSNYGLVVLEVRRIAGEKRMLLKNVEQKLAGPDTVLQAGDLIYLNGDRQQARRLAADYRLAEHAKGNGADEDSLSFYDIGMAETVILPQSMLVGRRLEELGMRSKYRINVVGIRRAGEYIMDDLPSVRLGANDVLLVQGTWESIARMSSDEQHWVVIGQPLEEATKVTLDYKAPIAAAIMLMMVAMLVFDFIPVTQVTAVMLAGVLVVLAGCFRNVEDAYKSINWESIVLIAAMMPMSVALEKTGVSSTISHTLVDILGSIGPAALLAGIYVTTTLFTFFISNTATAVLMSPIAMSAAVEMGASPYPMLIAVAAGANLCFATPFSTPPNALVMQAGQYKFIDYVKVGLPLQIVLGVVILILLPILFPL